MESECEFWTQTALPVLLNRPACPTALLSMDTKLALRKGLQQVLKPNHLAEPQSALHSHRLQLCRESLPAALRTET